jgi:transcriptional regulator GlxA family with amidase domain
MTQFTNDKGAADSAMTDERRPHCIVIVAFDGVQTLDVIGPADVFAKAEEHRNASYTLIIASPHGGNVVAKSGVVLGSTIALSDLPATIDTLLVAGSNEGKLRQAIFDDGLGDWFKHRAPSVRRVGSICTGAFVLAAAGLLDGKRATTHWGSCETLQNMFPSAHVEADTIYTCDAPIFTSAGVTAGIDLALCLVDDDFGRDLANVVARDLVVFVRRAGNQSQMSAALAAQANASSPIKDLITWITSNTEQDLSVTSLAQRVGMSERNFSRAFRTQTGQTPGQLVEIVRIEQVCDLLQRTNWPNKRLAERCGFGSVDALQRAFGRNIGSTLNAYRNQFR